jgi:hypothetical protein
MIVSPAQTVLSTSGGKSPQISEADKPRLEMQCLRSRLQSSAVIGKNEDGSDITHDVDILVW